MPTQQRTWAATWRATGLLATYLIATTTLIGCKGESSAARRESRKPLIVVATAHPDDPQWTAILGGTHRYQDGLPTVRLAVATPAPGSAAGLMRALTAEFTKHPRILCLHVTEADLRDHTELDAVLDLATREQVPVITMGARYEDARVYGHAGVSLTQAGELLGTALPESGAGRRRYLLLHGAGEDPLATTAYQRFASASQKQSDLTLLREQSTADSQRSPAELLGDLLALFPHAGLLVTLSPEVWLCAAPEELHRFRDQNREFHFATLSTVPPLWRYLGTTAKPGLAAALVGGLDGDVGYAALEMATRVALSEREPNPIRWIDAEIVTVEALPDFAQRYAKAAGGMDVSSFLPDAAATQP